MPAAVDPRPTKVLVAAQYLDPEVGGAERYAAEIGARLSARSAFELHHLSSDGSSELPAARIRLWTTGFDVTWPGRVRALLDRVDPDVLYVHHTVPGLTDLVLRSAAARRIPVALMYHGDVTGSEWPKRLVGEAYGRTIGRGSLAVPSLVFVASSAYAARSPVLRRAGARLVEAPPGVDPDMARGTRGDGRYLLFVGKPRVRSKGLEPLLAAWRRVHRDWPDHELRIAGGDDGERLEAPGVRHLGRIRERRRLADLYAGAAATVLPSLSHAESFGMVLAEALVAGSPIVGSDVGGIPSLVEEGRNGRLVPPGDVPALAAALHDLLARGPAYRGYVAARAASYARRFSWDATADVVAQGLSELAASRGPARVPAGVPA